MAAVVVGLVILGGRALVALAVEELVAILLQEPMERLTQAVVVVVEVEAMLAVELVVQVLSSFLMLAHKEQLVEL
jgi:hypothetical protein